MKNFYLLALLITFSLTVKTQVAFYDAQTLRGFLGADGKFDPDKKDTIEAILSKYLNKFETIPTVFGANPFFENVFQREVTLSSKKSSSLLSFAGSLNVTNLADGLARFLIKRGKEELNVAFFNRMKKFLDNPEYPECRTLFPATTKFLESIDVSRYAEFLQSLREAFHKDVSNLITSLNQLIDLPKYHKLLDNIPEIRITLRSIKIVNELSQSGSGVLPDSIIHQLSRLKEWGEIDFNLSSGWQALDVISQSIRFEPWNSELTKQRWVSISDLNVLIQDTTTLKFYLGLVFVKMKGIAFKTKNDTVAVQQFMQNNKNHLLRVVALTENFLTLASDVDRTIQDIRDKQESKSFTPEDYYTYIGKSINLFEYGFTVANTIHPQFIDSRYITMARSGNNLYKNIYTKNYNNAVMDVYNILQLIFDKKEILIEEKVANTAAAPASLNATLNSNLASVTFPDSKLIEGILKYGNFMASVIKAESAEDVEQALDAAALPSGSYSIKQKSNLNISVNAYIGYSRDYLSVFNDQYAHGIYAPLGISVSHGTRKKHGFSFTGFVSLIDVGSVAAYRLQSGNDENLKQEVRLESIYSPSAQLLIEYRGLPLAIGGGWRRTPKLFYAGNSSFNVVSPKSVFNFSVLVDIPLFTIHNRPFDKK